MAVALRGFNSTSNHCSIALQIPENSNEGASNLRLKIADTMCQEEVKFFTTCIKENDSSFDLFVTALLVLLLKTKMLSLKLCI